MNYRDKHEHKQKKRFLALFLSLMMVFSTLIPLEMPVYADSSSSDEIAYSADNSTSQTIEIPIVNKTDNKVSYEGKSFKMRSLFSGSSPSVAEAVYGNVYTLQGWETVDCSFSYDDGAAIIEKAPILLSLGEDFAKIYEESMQFEITLRDSKDKIIPIQLSEDNIRANKDYIELLGIAYNILPGAYTVSLKAYMGQEVFNFNTINQTYKIRPVTNGTVYAPLKASRFHVDLDNLGSELTYMTNDMSFEIVDNEGNVVAQTNNKIENIYGGYAGHWSYDGFEEEFDDYYLGGVLFKTAAFDAAKTYELKLFVNDVAVKTEIELPEKVEVKFTDAPVINYIDLYREYEDPLVDADTSFRIMTSVSNLNNKNDLELEMIDSIGEVIAKSTASAYANIYTHDQSSEIVYTMELLPNRKIVYGEEYSLRINHNYAKLINKAENVTLHGNPMPRILSVETDEAKQGKFTINAVNLEPGKEYNVSLDYRGTPPTFSKEQPKAVEPYSSAPFIEKNAGGSTPADPYGDYETKAVYNTNGQLEASFKTPDGQPIPFGNGYYYIDISENERHIGATDFRINEREYNQEQEIGISYPRTIPLSVNSYDFELGFDNIVPTKDNLKIELVDDAGAVLAEADYSTLEIQEYKYKDKDFGPYKLGMPDYKRYGVYGSMKLKQGALPAEDKAYKYKIAINNTEFDGKKIYGNYIRFTDEIFTNGMYIRENIYSRLLESGYGGYGDYIPTNENQLNIEMFDVINLPEGYKDKLKVVLYTQEGNALAYSWTPASISHHGDVYKSVELMVDLGTKEVADGSYIIHVEYDGKSIINHYVQFTSKPAANEVHWSRITAPPATKLILDFYGAINIDGTKASAKISGMNNELITTATHEKTNMYPDYKYEFNVELKPGKALEEGNYIIENLYDGKPIYNEYNSYGWQNLITVTSIPMLNGYGRHIDNNGTTTAYKIYTMNFDSTKNYRGYFYYDEEDVYNADRRLIKEINLGKVNENGVFEISSEALSGMPNGSYNVIVESENGIVIDETYFRIYGNVVAPPTDIEPKVSINKGAAYTNSASVKLTIDAPGYSQIKIAESETALEAVGYQSFTNESSYALSTGDGMKTLFFKFKADDGKLSKVIKQSIYLDTAVPTSPSAFGIKNSEGAIVADPIVLQSNDYVQLFAIGEEKYIKAYARITGNDINETIKLGFVNQTDNKVEYAVWVRLSDYYKNATNISYFFEDYAGNISKAVTKQVEVKSLAKVFGEVVKAGTEPVKYQSILLQIKEGDTYKDYRWAYSNADGEYEFENIPNGDYRLFSYAPRGYVDAQHEFTVSDYKNYGWVIDYADKYADRGNLTVNVKEFGNINVEGANIYLSNWEIGEYYYASTVGGKVEINNIPTTAEGIKYYLSIYHNGYSKSEEILIKGDTTKDIVVPAIGTIKGTVINKDNVPQADMDVYAVSNTGQYVWARTNAEGKYELRALKDENTKYKVYVKDYKTNKLAPNRTWSEIVPNKEAVDFTMYSKPTVSGIVKGSDGANIGTILYANGIDTWDWYRSDSDATGNFQFKKVFDVGKYNINAYAILGYYNASKEIEITEADLMAGQKDIGTIELQSYTRDIFTGNLNNVRTDVSYIQKGKNITVRVNYHNTKNVNLDNVTIKALLPEGIALVVGSGSLEKKIVRLKADEKGELTFAVKVGESFNGSRATIKAAAVYNGKEQAIGYADVDVVSATINAPSEIISNKTFKVYGEATLDSEVSIIAKNNATGEQKNVAFTKPSGRWYYADIKSGLTAGEYKLYAKVTKGNETGFSEYADITVTDDAISIEDIAVVSPSGQSLGVNEETGVAAFSVWVNPQLVGKPIDVSVKFNKENLAGHYEFIGEDYAATYHNGYMSKLIEGWSGSGIQKLYYVTDDGKRFIIAEITILIDPSGYVYDKFTNQRISGATVTCEIKENGSWIKWDAAKYGQINPQLTDEEGNYGWMVPDGEYRVKAQKNGYEAYVTTTDGNPKLESIVIPPPRMDVNIGLTNIEKPMVKYTIPENTKTAGTDTQIAVAFSKPIDSTLNTAKLEVTDSSSNKVLGTISFTDNDTRVVFSPTNPLEHGKVYNVLLNGFKDKKDRGGNARDLGDYGFSFTVNQDVKTVYLKNTEISPANGATNIEKTTVVTMTFDKDLDISSLTDTTVRLETAAGAKVKAVLKIDKNKVTLTPDDPLMASTTYKVIIESDVKSIEGYYLEKDIITNFSTKADPTTPGSGGGSSGGGGGGGTPTTPSDVALAKVDEAINKGAKDITFAVDKNGNVELSKAAIDKLISKGMNITLQSGSTKATIDLADIKDQITKAAKINFVLKEKTGDILQGDYKKLSNTLELKVLADSKEISISKKLDIKIDLGALPKEMTNNLKAGVYKKIGTTLVYVPGSHMSKKGIVSFEIDSFGEFVIAEYSKKFEDMSKYQWASDFVEIMAARQITTGTGGNNFSPGAQVTRAQFAAFITNALGLEAAGAKATFSDVESGKWYTEAIASANAAGIIKGDGKGKFNPNEPVTREQMAVMIMRAYEYKTGIVQSGNAKFEDMSQISEYARGSVLGAKQLGIIEGAGGNNFMPKDISIRAAAAKMIVKLLELITE